MTETDVNVVCSSSSRLFSEMTTWLDEVIHVLPNEFTNDAKIFRQRSQEQVRQLSKVISDNDSNRYVDMNSANGKDAPESIDLDQNPTEQEQYVQIEHEKQDTLSEEECEDSIKCPFAKSPVSVTSTEKCGLLDRKERFFLSLLEHQRKFFATIYQGWLLLYFTDKDNKPCAMYNLRLYEAKHIEKKDTSFELISKKLENKPQLFTAQTKKDAVQWVRFLNKAAHSGNHTIRPLKEKSKEPVEEVIYEVLPDNEEKQIPVKLMEPILPPRIELHIQKSLPEPPKEIETEDQYERVFNKELQDKEEPYYDELHPKKKQELIYDEVCVPPRQDGEKEIYDPVGNDENDSLEEYHEIFEPQEPVKTPIVKAKLFRRDKAKLLITSGSTKKKSFNFMSKN